MTGGATGNLPGDQLASAATMLVAAVQAGDTAATAAVLTDHPALRRRLNDPLPGLPFDSTVIHAAASAQNVELLDLLIAAGADINQLTHWWAGGFHVLDDADAAFVLALLARGAVLTINAAAKWGMEARVEQFLADDAGSIHSRGGDGQTPLHVASTVGIARLLLDDGGRILTTVSSRDFTDGQPARWRDHLHLDAWRRQVRAPGGARCWTRRCFQDAHGAFAQ